MSETPGPDEAHHDAHQQALLAHLSGVLGQEYVVATERTVEGIALDLAVFAPSEQFPHPTLVTLGMSQRPMTAPGGEQEVRLELLIGLPAGWPGIDPPDPELLEDPANSWPVRLLTDTARIPSTDGSFLDWGHSITNNGERYDGSAPFTGALIGPPYGYPPQLMNASTPAGGVQILAVLPATAAELAAKVSVPSGGDMVLGRLAQAGVTAVLDPSRESVTGPAPWHVHVLLAEHAEHLGEVLEGVLPNMASQLGSQGIDEFVLPVGQEPLRWRVGGRLAPSAVEEDLALAALPEEDHTTLRRAVAEHGGVLTLSPQRPGDGETVSGAAAMVAMLVEAGKVAAIWLPYQNHLVLPAQFVADIDAERPTMCRVHLEPLADGSVAVMTHGLTALGGAEVLFSAPDLSLREHTQLLDRLLVEGAERVAAAPKAGQSARLGSETYTVRTGVHRDSGQEILEMVAEQAAAN
ncbi:suppressor of fused domain protein [Brachybacterium sp. FME24]|uniref:suppressor of fused domain protein n=1 Tax=Brachybacterium sp. FME24 TaxID=2742605 RepID=UPI0018662A3E|nr:suppressor of fused domain protein [Brachybacterium sp. FME24]